MDLTELAAAHAARLRSVDQLIPPPASPRTGDESIEILAVEVGDTAAVGIASRPKIDPNTLLATWGALRRYRLAVRVAGDRPAEAVDELLNQWDRLIVADAVPGDRDSSAIVSWPTRDTDAVPALIAHGFAPLTVIAARRYGQTLTPMIGAGLRIRPATADDLDVVTELQLALVAVDAQFGATTLRPSTAAATRDWLADRMARDHHGVWLAERSGEPVGHAVIDLPPDTDWLATQVAGGPVGYFASLYVVPHLRGSGVGGALVDEAHRVLDEHGVGVTLLHHALPNPRSTPFWYSHGYRPLWTLWQRRPAVPVLG